MAKNTQQLIQNYLAALPSAFKEDQHHASRMIWRLGELKATEAVPLLMERLVSPSDSCSTEDWLLNYSIVWVIANSKDARGISTLETLLKSNATPAYVKRLCLHGLYHIAKKKGDVDILLADFNRQLTNDWQTIVNAESSHEQYELLLALLSDDYDKEERPYLEFVLLYLLSLEQDNLHQALLRLASTLAFEEHRFWLIRLLYKLAEFEKDAELFALIIKRIETTKSPSYNWWSDNQTFSYETRNYLKRRGWRWLKHLGDQNDTQYVWLASQLLQSYNDLDDQTRKGTMGWYETTYYPPFASHIAYNQILYRSAKAICVDPSSYCWTIDSDEDDTGKRTEAYPHLWDEQPQALIDCLVHSESGAVHNFAYLGVKDKHDFCRNIPLDKLGKIFCKPYEETYLFAQNLIINHHTSSLKELAFLQSLIDARYKGARSFIHSQLMLLPKSTLLETLDWHLTLIFSVFEDNREHSKDFHHFYTGYKDKQALLLAKLISIIQSYTESTLPEGDILDLLTWTINEPLQKASGQMNINLIADLIKHQLIEVQRLGANILVNRDDKSSDIPSEIYTTLLESEDAELKALGVRLLGKLDKRELAEMPDLLTSLMLSHSDAIRQEASTIVHDVAASNNRFAETMLEHITPHLFKAEPHEGVHDTLVDCVLNSLQRVWRSIDKNSLWRLLMAQSKAAQRVGSAILETRSDRDYSVKQWAHLAKNNTLAVRQWAMQAFDSNSHTIRKELSSALRILDNKWDDSRQFALDYFREKLSERDWTSDTLILLCDSVRPDVQDLGRELLQKFFKDEQGEDYLLKLSQHPARNVQLFASDFLQDHAAGNVEVIKKLQPYFVSVLSSVNQGRVAKDRVLNFLIEQSQQNAEAAEQVASLLDHQSITVAIQDKAHFIEAMLSLQKQYPDLKLPLKSATSAVRGYSAEVQG